MSFFTTHESSIFEPRLKGIALAGLSFSPQLNTDTIYLFGGGQSNLWTLNTSLINEEYSEKWIGAQSATPLHWNYAPPGLPWRATFDNKSDTDATSGFLVVGQAQLTESTLSVHSYDTITSSWSQFSPTYENITNATTLLIPAASKHHSAILLNDTLRILVYGGENRTHAIGHFWSFDIQHRRWTPLALPTHINVMRCGHSANLLDDGRLLILGGFICTKDQLLNDNGWPNKLAEMSKAVLYNTILGEWSEQPTLGPYPQPRAYHTAVKSALGLVVIVGGQDGTPPPYQIYVSSNAQMQDMLAILNTSTWQWTLDSGTSTMNQPLPQSMAAIGLMLDDHKLLYGFGTSYQTVYSGLYIFDTSTHQWIPPSWDQEHDEWMATTSVDTSSGMTETRHLVHIVLACVGTLCFLTMLALLYRMGARWKQKLLGCLSLFKSKIWKPRIGEPSWTESVRLTIMFVYLCFFVFLIFCLADQVVNSPIIDQVSYVENPSSTVNVPDIRFCLDDEHSVIRCGTDLGMQCSDYLITISNSMRRHRNQHCYLFRAPPYFKLGQISDRLTSNGSYLKFDYYFGQPSQLEVVFYNTRHNPNLAVYSIKDPYNTSFTWNDPLEETTFRLSERKGAMMNNIYQLDVNVVSSASYELIQRSTLLDTFWNYVGFSPDVETFYEIDTKVQSETTPSDYSSIPRPLGSLHVYPRHYEIKTLHEQRAFAMVNATGVFGGLFGLLVSLQACLFGYRPRSPLGVIHRWSIGDMKRSLLNGLQKSFVPQTTNVPIVHPMRDPTLRSTRMLSRSMVMEPTLPTSKTTDSMASSTTESSNRAASPTLSPSSTLPRFTCQKPARITTRQPVSFFDDGFVEEPESYDDDNWILGGAERLTRMEDRMEVLEKVFQAYYIDDEIFTALGLAAQPESLLPPATTRMNQLYQRQRSTLSSLRFRTLFKRRP